MYHARIQGKLWRLLRSTYHLVQVRVLHPLLGPERYVLDLRRRRRLGHGDERDGVEVRGLHLDVRPQRQRPARPRRQDTQAPVNAGGPGRAFLGSQDRHWRTAVMSTAWWRRRRATCSPEDVENPAAWATMTRRAGWRRHGWAGSSLGRGCCG